MSTETVELVVFVIFAAVSLAGAVTMVWARNPVRSVMGLLATMFSIAVFYLLNSGFLIAAVQVIVYAGAVLTLFLFVVMLIGVDQAEDRTEGLPLQRQLAVIGSVLLAALVIAGASGAWVTGAGFGVIPDGSVEAIANKVFGEWVLPFEITGLLFIVAAAGTIALAQFKSDEGEGFEEPAVEEEAT